jgi:hypothetical protein
MVAFNFPDTPYVGQVYVSPLGATYKWAPPVWQRVTENSAPLFQFDDIYTNLLFNPPVYGEKDDYLGRPPDTEPDVYNNIVIAPGYKGFPTSGTDNDFYSNTFVGKGIGAWLKWSRYTDAYGTDTLKWAKYSERNTIVGSLGLPWLGQDLTTDTTRNPDYPTVQRYYEHDTLNDNGILWTDPTWDPFGCKARYPGLPAAISAWVASNPWVDAKVAATPGSTPYGYVIANVVVGRDALNQMVIGYNNVAVGYRAAALQLEGNYTTAVGYQSNYMNAFASGNTAFGAFANRTNQDGGYNVAVGYKAGNGVIHGSNNIFLGATAGAVGADAELTVDVTMNNSIFIGCFSGYGYTDTTITDVLHIRNRSTNGPLIAGDFTSKRLAVGAMPVSSTIFTGYRGVLTVYSAASGAAAVNGSADELVLENNNAVGMTFMSPNTNAASIYFADPESALAGYVQYNHGSDYLRFGVNATERMRLTATGMGFNGSPAIAKPSITGSRAANAALADLLTKLASYGLLTDTTTA